MSAEIIAAIISAAGAVAAAWIDRRRFQRRRHVDSADLRRLDAIIVSQRSLIARQRREILSLRKWLNGAGADLRID